MKWNNDISMTLYHRDIEIFKHSIELLRKKIAKSASMERDHFGAGNLTELEEYIEGLQRLIDAALENTVMVTGE
jgi:hypothetical protein